MPADGLVEAEGVGKTTTHLTGTGTEDVRGLVLCGGAGAVTEYYLLLHFFCYQERVSSFFPRRTMEQDERSAMGIYGDLV